MSSPSGDLRELNVPLDWQNLSVAGMKQTRSSKRGAGTRRRIIVAAADLFAERGVEAVSLKEILERAGQSNESAIHYHFGSREGLVLAILRQESPAEPARAEMLQQIEDRGDHAALADCVAALVLPVGEAMKTRWGRNYIRLAAQAIRQLPIEERIRPVEPTSRRALEMIEQRMVGIPPDLREERLGAAITLTAELWSSRAEEIEHRHASNLPEEAFERDLVAILVEMLSAPVG
jgi:TetR/AcrR family transcriptional regulator, regulator of cefoperazone and chloramphenicol sensitivity